MCRRDGTTAVNSLFGSVVVEGGDDYDDQRTVIPCFEPPSCGRACGDRDAQLSRGPRVGPVLVVSFGVP
jgi:hypothetical protein